MGTFVSLAICMILAVHYTAGAYTLRCFEGNIGGWRAVDCPGSCYIARSKDHDRPIYSFGCSKKKHEDGCKTGKKLRICFCNKDLCF